MNYKQLNKNCRKKKFDFKILIYIAYILYYNICNVSRKNFQRGFYK